MTREGAYRAGKIQYVTSLINQLPHLIILTFVCIVTLLDHPFVPNLVEKYDSEPVRPGNILFTSPFCCQWCALESNGVLARSSEFTFATAGRVTRLLLMHTVATAVSLRFFDTTSLPGTWRFLASTVIRTTNVHTSHHANVYLSTE